MSLAVPGLGARVEEYEKQEPQGKKAWPACLSMAGACYQMDMAVENSEKKEKVNLSCPIFPVEENLKKGNNKFQPTLLDVGETALGFFFLILIPGTGAELSASRKPKLSIANRMEREKYV